MKERVDLKKKRPHSPGNVQRTASQMKHYTEGAFAMLNLCRLQGIPDNRGVVDSLAKASGVKPPPDFGNSNGKG